MPFINKDSDLERRESITESIRMIDHSIKGTGSIEVIKYRSQDITLYIV